MRLSPPYEGAAERAERSGWPTDRAEADHLAVVTRPEEVAGHVEALLGAIRHTPSAP